jgi:hypothetical protein
MVPILLILGLLAVVAAAAVVTRLAKVMSQRKEAALIEPA